MIEYALGIAILISIWSLLAQSFNLSFGLTGLFNLGHIIFFGLGAYIAGVSSTLFDTTFWIHLVLGTIGGSLVAFFIGILTLRLSSHYLAICTLGLSLITATVATNWMAVTRGPLGISGIHSPLFFGVEINDTIPYLGLTLLIVIPLQWALYRLFHSPWGRLQRAIQDDEIAALSLGKNTLKAKMSSLVISGIIASIAGVLYAHYRLYIDPTIFSMHEIILLLVMVIVGGRGNFWGSIAGVVFIFLLGELPRFIGFPIGSIGPARNILFAVVLLTTLYVKPNGVFSHNSKQA